MRIVRLFYPFFLIALNFFIVDSVNGQEASKPNSNEQLQSAENKQQEDAKWNTKMDLVDLYHKIIKKDSFVRKDLDIAHLSLVPAVGYTTVTGFAGVVSANIGFFTVHHQHETEKISSISSSIAYTQYNQTILPIQADIWTRDNKYNIISDWRYMNYPSTTFGLGRRSKANNGDTIDFNYIKIHQTLMRKISNNLYAGLGVYFDYFWNIREIGVPAGQVTSFEKYGLTQKEVSSGIAFRLLLDTRKNQINPDAGWYLNVVDRPNFAFMGSDNNWQSLLIDARKYFYLPRDSKNVLAFWNYDWITVSGKPPYLMLPSTGWDDFYNTGRGYLQGRYRGRDMVYFESEYRFTLTRNGLLGMVVFANVQSFSKDLSQQFQILVPGAGTGLRIRLNKFSGANLCVDYGWGIDGQQGISVNLGEVF